MLSFKVFCLLILISLINCTNYLDWCDYWRALQRDHVRAECNGLYRIRFSKLRDNNAKQLPAFNRDLLGGFHRYRSQIKSKNQIIKKMLGIEECGLSFIHCETSYICDSGLLCRAKVNSQTCCAPSKSPTYNSCPASNIRLNCLSKQRENVCTHNYQCYSSSARKCCPTTCGYSICL